MSRITIVTIKNFIRDNKLNLWIKFQNKDIFRPVEKSTRNNIEHHLGIEGAWFVLRSRDTFFEYNKDGFIGYEIYNCTTSFVITRKADSNITKDTRTKVTIDSRPESARLLTADERHALALPESDTKRLKAMPGMSYKIGTELEQENKKHFPELYKQRKLFHFIWIYEMGTELRALYQQWSNALDRWIYITYPVTVEYI